jgi:hypothetical protein
VLDLIKYYALPAKQAPGKRALQNQALGHLTLDFFTKLSTEAVDN